MMMRRFFLFLALLCGVVDAARADSEPYVGDLSTAAYTFCPQDTLLANGQVLSANDYPALYSVIGTKFGSNGQGTFALPNLNPSYTASDSRPTLVQCIAVDGPIPPQP